MQKKVLACRVAIPLVCVTATLAGIPAGLQAADEIKSAKPVYMKLEAEDFEGFGAYKGKAVWTHCMAWYPQWSRGGASGWWSAQGDAASPEGEIGLDTTIPQTDKYRLWVRYEDYKGEQEPFAVAVCPAEGKSNVKQFGLKDSLEPAKPPFAWAFAWDSVEAELKKGPVRVTIGLTGVSKVRRGVDCVVLTTDQSWQPKDRGFPPMAYATYLQDWAAKREPLAPLSRKAGMAWSVPKSWELPKTAGRDFWHLGGGEVTTNFPLPLTISGAEEKAAYIRVNAANPGKAPVFSSPVTAIKLGPRTDTLLNPESLTRRYILEKKVPFVVIGNYASFGKVKDSYPTMKQTFGELWVSIISGEGSYMGMPLIPAELSTGPDFKQKTYEWLFTSGREEWKKRLGEDWASTIDNPFEKVTQALSVETRRECHRFAEAGTTVIGAESASAMAYIQNQIAFVRGAARQYGIRWLWYWGASFGDAIRTFITESPYNLELEGIKVENRNAVIGPSLAHIRRTMLMAYFLGASFFHPEQGYNMIGTDGQLNPMGWCYDEMTRLASRHPDRGVPCTPIAILMDRAHGWEKYTYNGERVWAGPQMRRADRMIGGFFNIAYFPFPRNEGDPVDDLNVPWPNGYFGDVFDVLVTSPTRMDAVDAYPVVFCLGDTRLDAQWAGRLRKYVMDGGTLVINAEQVVPPLDAEFLGVKTGSAKKDASVVVSCTDSQKLAGTVFPYAVVEPTTAKVVARTDTGDPVALVNDVGKGRVVLTTPSYLLGHDEVPMPYMARLLQEVTSGLLPVEVRGNVEYAVNLHPKGYVVMLSNNEGIAKMSHSPAKMDRKKTSEVVLRLREKPVKTEDWLGEEPQSWSFPEEWLPEYTQPMKVEWKSDGDQFVASITLRAGEMRIFYVETRK